MIVVLGKIDYYYLITNLWNTSCPDIDGEISTFYGDDCIECVCVCAVR